MADAPFRTVPEGFLATSRRLGSSSALRWREGEGFGSWTWNEYADRAARFAGGLRNLGLQRGDRVLLLMPNRPEFHISDMGTLLAGGTPISIYNSSSPEQIAYFVQDSEARVAVVEGGDYLDRLLRVRAQLPDLRHIVVVEGDNRGETPFADVLEADPVDLEEAASAVRPDDLATVIYTSGTTGTPKGVMLNHTNICAEYGFLTNFLGPDGAGWRLVSYLPMAHVAERVISHYNQVQWGCEVTTCPDQTQLLTYLATTRPHVLFGPPRVWEKLAAGIRAVVSANPEAAAKLDAMLPLGRQVSDLRALDQPLPPELAGKWDAVDAALFGPIRAKIGLDECRIAFSGAAPIPVEIVQFLRDIGLPMSEVYGLSENTGGMTWDPFRVKPGTVGRALPGVEVRTAPDGEVLCRGPIVFQGYLNDPERTAETIDADGWMHSGDIGEIDDEGYLRIIDRKKELIITAGGKNLSPANLEAALKSIPLVGQAMVVGDNHPYVAALLVLDPDIAPAWAQQHGLGSQTLTELAADETVLDEVARGVIRENEHFSHAEQIKRFALLGEEWLPDSPMLTPTMKLKRRGVLAHYSDVIDSLYAGGGVEVSPAATQPTN